jgi:D-3-phosphoglycerate dehydrogenase
MRIAPETTGQAIAEAAIGADAIIARDPIPSIIFDRSPGVRIVVRHGAGTDGIDLDAATRAGVLVATTPGANATAVAEHAVMAALMLLRRFRAIDQRLRSEGWESARSAAQGGRQLSGMTIGLIGAGAVAQAIQRIAGPGFGARVLGYQPPGFPEPPGFEFRPLDDLLATADVVIVACPLNDLTRGLLNARRIALIRRHAYLINIARGPVVDEPSLVNALRDGRIAGAALDVFANQPLAPGHPLFGLENVVLTPHMASLTIDSMRAVGLMAVEALTAFWSGQRPAGTVNEPKTAHR